MHKDVEYINSPIEQTVEVGYIGLPREHTAVVGSDDVNRFNLNKLDERYEFKVKGLHLLAEYELERGKINE